MRLEMAEYGKGSILVLLSSVDIVIAAVCASRRRFLMLLACVFVSVTKLMKVGVVSWAVVVGTIGVRACSWIEVRPVAVAEAVVCRRRLADDCNALPLTLSVPALILLMLTFESWLRVSSSKRCNGVWMCEMFIMLALSVVILGGDR